MTLYQFASVSHFHTYPVLTHLHRVKIMVRAIKAKEVGDVKQSPQISRVLEGSKIGQSNFGSSGANFSRVSVYGSDLPLCLQMLPLSNLSPWVGELAYASFTWSVAPPPPPPHRCLSPVLHQCLHPHHLHLQCLPGHSRGTYNETRTSIQQTRASSMSNT